MADLNNITVTLKKSEFNLTAVKVDDKLQVADPVTLKNQIQEIHSIDDLGLNLTNRREGSVVTYNSVTNQYDVKPLPFLSSNSALYPDYPNSYVWSNTTIFAANVVFNAAIIAGSTSGSPGQVLTTSSRGVYWSTPFIFSTGLSNSNGTITVNSSYIATISANNALYLNGKTESTLNVNSAIYSNNALYLNYKPEAALNVNSSIYANTSLYLSGKLETNLNVNNAIYSNNSLYLNGKSEGSLNVNSAIYINGKIESSLSVNNAIYANTATYLNGKPEANLNVDTSTYSTFASIANSAIYVNNKPEGSLNVNTAIIANTALYFNGIIDCGVY